MKLNTKKRERLEKYRIWNHGTGGIKMEDFDNHFTEIRWWDDKVRDHIPPILEICLNHDVRYSFVTSKASDANPNGPEPPRRGQNRLQSD